MPIVGWILAALVTAGWLACEAPDPAAPPTTAVSPAVGWRRTSKGWEQLDRPELPPLKNPGFHPALFAALLTLGSTLSLLAFPAERPVEPQSPPAERPRRRRRTAQLKTIAATPRTI